VPSKVKKKGETPKIKSMGAPLRKLVDNLPLRSRPRKSSHDFENVPNFATRAADIGSEKVEKSDFKKEQSVAKGIDDKRDSARKVKKLGNNGLPESGYFPVGKAMLEKVENARHKKNEEERKKEKKNIKKNLLSRLPIHTSSSKKMPCPDRATTSKQYSLSSSDSDCNSEKVESARHKKNEEERKKEKKNIKKNLPSRLPIHTSSSKKMPCPDSATTPKQYSLSSSESDCNSESLFESSSYHAAPLSPLVPPAPSLVQPAPTLVPLVPSLAQRQNPPISTSLLPPAPTLVPPVPSLVQLQNPQLQLQDKPTSDYNNPVFSDDEDRPEYHRFTKEHRRLEILTFITTRETQGVIIQYSPKRLGAISHSGQAKVKMSRGPCFQYRLNSITLRADGIATAYFICTKQDKGNIRCNGQETYWCKVTNYNNRFSRSKKGPTIKLREEYEADFFTMFSQIPPEERVRGETRHKMITTHRCKPLGAQEMGETDYQNEINIQARFNHRAKMDVNWICSLQDNVRRWYPGWVPHKALAKATRLSKFVLVISFNRIYKLMTLKNGYEIN
jgi:hypothetical protein